MGYELLIKISVKANKNYSYQKSDSLLIHVFFEMFYLQLTKRKAPILSTGALFF